MDMKRYRDDRWSAGRVSLLATVAAVAAAGVVAACSSFETSFEERAVLGVTLEVPSTTSGATSGGVSSSVVVEEDGQTLTIDSVTVVLQEVQVARSGQECDFTAGATDADECEELQPADRPVSQDLPLEEGSVQLRARSIDPGEFDAVEFRFTALDGTIPSHTEALDGPVPDGASMRIWGDLDGEDVDVTVDLDEEQRLTFSPVDVSARETIEVTVSLDVSTWFLTESDGSTVLVDASDGLDDSEESVVEANIVSSLGVSAELTET